ncbi:MAG: hypothetical protein QM753_21095 [Thermomicrobiales bacterium]
MPTGFVNWWVISGAEVVVTGSMKYDGATTDCANPRITALRGLFRIRPKDRVLVAGSTMAPEESIIIDTWRQLEPINPDLKLILVPRHPERFEEVAQLLERENISFVHRSRLTGSEQSLPRVILVDTVVVAAVWGLADVGYVGGSLECRRGRRA